ncbi:glycosyltransferase family 4 protein [Brucellaceae bacterium D45D]
MKIGIDARNLVPGLTGIGRYVFEMCRRLALQGHELVLYLPEAPSKPLPEWNGVNVRIANYAGGIRRMIWGQTTLPRLAATDDLDIFWGPAHRLPSFLDRKIPRVVTIHDLVWMNAASTMRFQTWMGERVLMRPAILGADRIVAVSTATADAVKVAFPAAADKVRVVHSGLTRLSGFQSKETFSSFATAHQIDRPYALFVGTLEPRKNLARLLEAFARVPEENRNNLLLVIAGGQGWRLGDLTTLVAQLGIEPFVRLTGYVSDADLAGLYDNARFLAMPSLYEGFGFPIIEANAVGIPVLTSNSSSMPEVAGDAALLIDPNNVDAIADAINRLANDELLYRQLAERARPNAARFDWNKSTDSLLAVFVDAINNNSSEFSTRKKF